MPTQNGDNGNDNITGSSTDDILTGNGGDDVISGGDGNDVIEGDNPWSQVLGGNSLPVRTTASGRFEDVLPDDMGSPNVSTAGGNVTYTFVNPGASVSVYYIDPDGDLVFNTPQIIGGSTNTQSYPPDARFVVEENGEIVGFFDAAIDGTTFTIGTYTSPPNSLGNDTLDGGAGDDIISGGGGDDTIEGGTGDDTLSGGLGSDTISGGAGSDTISGDSGLTEITYDRTIATGSASDVMPEFTGSPTASAGAPTVTYYMDNSGDWYDVYYIEPDGTITFDDPGVPAGQSRDVNYPEDAQFALFQNGELVGIVDTTKTGTHFDPADPNFAFSAGGVDVIDGGEGDDTIFGEGGNDAIIGGADSDTISGGDGDDNIRGDGDGLTVDGGNSIPVRTTASGRFEEVLPDEMGSPNISTAGGNVTYTFVNPGASVSVYYIDPDGDLVFNTPQIIGGSTNTQSYPPDARFAVEENGEIVGFFDAAIDGTTFTIGEYTSEPSYVGDDVIDGGAGDDTIHGDSGDDTLLGGEDQDTLYGDLGDDTIFGGTGDDTIYGDNELTDITYDRTTFSGSASDVMPESTGSPTASAGAPTVTYYMDNSGDWYDVYYIEPDGSITFSDPGVPAGQSRTANYPEDAQFALFQNGELVGIVDTTKTGTHFDPADPNFAFSLDQSDNIDGGAGADTIDAQVGDDGVDGGLGDDTIEGGTGSDTLMGNMGDDVISGGEGDDTILGGSGDDTITVEMFELSGSDTISGGAGSDTIFGGLGNDVIYGDDEPGTFTTLGFEYNQEFTAPSLSVLASSDLSGVEITGEAKEIVFVDNDHLLHNDTVSDTFLSANDGSQFVYVNGVLHEAQVEGVATFTDGNGGSFEMAIVEVNLNGDSTSDDEEDGYYLVSVGTPPPVGATLTQTSFDDTSDLAYSEITVADDDGADVVRAGAGDDTIFGQGGNDYLQGQGGDDSIDGGDGDDTIYGDSLLNEITVDRTTVSGTLPNVLPAHLGSELPFAGSPTIQYKIQATDGNSDIYYIEPDGSLTFDSPLVFQGQTTTEYYPEGAQLAVFTDGELISIIDTTITGTQVDVHDPDYNVQPQGHDSIDGGKGDDEIYGQDGDDVIQGGSGSDTIEGDDGDDIIYGDSQLHNITVVRDIVTGTYNNVLPESTGSELTHAGNPTVSYSISSPTTVDVYYIEPDGSLTFDGPGVPAGSTRVQDHPEGAQLAVFSGNELVAIIDTTITGPTVDVSDPQFAIGAHGDDIIDGGKGDDIIYGQDGDDIISGGRGADDIVGGSGDDTIAFGNADQIEGGDDRDVFNLDVTQMITAGNTAITIDGGSGSTAAGDVDDYDTLDLKGLEILSRSETVDADSATAASTSGTVVVSNGYHTYTINYSEIENFICFNRGTMIETIEGPRPVETLEAGDMVLTQDNGYRALDWIGSRKISKEALICQPKLTPIRIKANALAPGVPETDLVVSPQHRVLLNSKIVERMFDEPEVLVAAKHLLEIEGVDYDTELESVEYFHFLFDQHEIVYANGTLTESLFTGPEALKALSEEAREEIKTIFPELFERDYTPKDAARHIGSGRQSRTMAMRHAKNGKPLVESA